MVVSQAPQVSSPEVNPLTETEEFRQLWRQVLKGKKKLIEGGTPRARRLRAFFTNLVVRVIENVPTDPIEKVSWATRVLFAYLNSPLSELRALKGDVEEEVDTLINEYVLRVNAQMSSLE